MSELPPGVRRLFRLRGSGGGDVRDVEEEVRSHVEHRVEQLVEEGWEESAARLEAGRLFSRNAETIRSLHVAARERNRRMRSRVRWESWVQDARFALRSLARDPLLAGFAIVTLALGIGVNVTSFSLVDRLVLRDPLHVNGPDELVRLYGTVDSGTLGERTNYWIPWGLYRNLSAGMTGWSAVAAFRVQPRVVGRGESARRVRVAQTMGDFFGLTGADPLRGRFWVEGDAESAGRVAVIGARYWETAFDGDPAALGGTLMVEGTEHTIVGIAPAGYSGLETRRVDVWVPGELAQAGTMNWQVIGRIRPGVPREAISAEVRAIFAATADDVPQWYREAHLYAGSIRSDETGQEPFETTMAKWLSAVAAVILLVALANVVSLLLVRLARRKRELAVRVALGSGRGRVIRLLAVEGVLLGLGSGFVSLWVARLSEPLVRRALFADEASWSFTLMDMRVLGIALAVALITAVVTGLAPAVQAWGPHLSRELRSGAQGGAGGSRLRGVLTVVQAALSVMLLVGAGLFVRSLGRVASIDLGIDQDEVIAATVHLPEVTEYTQAAFAEATRLEIDVHRRLREALSSMAGVEGAAVAVGLPLDGGWFSAPVHVEGMDSVPTRNGAGPWASAVGPGYFETAGTTLLRGRPFTESDAPGAEPVIIIGQTMATRMWPGGEPLGACVRIGRSDSVCRRVVGIVEDVHRVGLRDQPSLQFYMPIGQQSMFAGSTLLIRPSPGSRVTMSALKRAMVAVDPVIRGVELRWLRDDLDPEMRPLRLGMVTFGLSAVLALVVVIVGLYGLMSYMVEWRTREIGVRMAIGANALQITGMVIRTGVGLACLGIAIGLMVSFWASRWVEPHLFRTRGSDPLVFCGVAAALLVVAVISGWLPARRAMRISPTEALRAE